MALPSCQQCSSSHMYALRTTHDMVFSFRCRDGFISVGNCVGSAQPRKFPNRSEDLYPQLCAGEKIRSLDGFGKLDGRNNFFRKFNTQHGVSNFVITRDIMLRLLIRPLFVCCFVRGCKSLITKRYILSTSHTVRNSPQMLVPTELLLHIS